MPIKLRFATCVFPSQVYSIKSLQMILDAQFESMDLAIGQIAMLKALLVAEDKPVDESKGKST